MMPNEKSLSFGVEKIVPFTEGHGYMKVCSMQKGCEQPFERTSGLANVIL